MAYAMGQKSFVSAAFVACLSVSGAAFADDSTWSYRALQLQYYNTDTSQWLPANLDVSYDTSALTNGIKLFGTAPDNRDGSTNLVTMTGSQYQPGGEGEFRGMRLIGVMDGFLNRPWNNAFDRIKTDFKFQVVTSGGNFEMFNAQTDYGLLNASDDLLQLVGSSGATAFFEPGVNAVNFTYVDGFGGANANEGTHIVGDFVINFTWDGGADDLLQINVSTDSIDIQQVPAPGTLATLAAIGLFAKRRRR